MIEELDDLTLVYMYGAKNGRDSMKAEIERLREALALADAALSGANMNMRVVEKKIRAALEGEKTDV
jgi:hypothetical protein